MVSTNPTRKRGKKPLLPRLRVGLVRRGLFFVRIQRNILDRLVYLVVRIVVCVVQALRIETCATLAGGLATLFCDVLKVRQDVIDDNLRHAFPSMSPQERREIAWRMWEHLFLMGIEIVHAPRKIHDTNWRDYVTLHNADRITRAIFDDRPAVLICGHYGNFELSGYVMGILGFPTYTIARPLDNPHLDRWLNEFRGLTGQYIVSKTGSAHEIESILARGGTLALLGDQNAGPKGCWVEFFGRPASSHKAIALFTLGSEAPTVFCYTRRTGRPLHLLMGTDAELDPRKMPAEMLSVPAITQWYTRQLEDTIRQAPEQYWWVHRRWKDTRPKKQAANQNRAA
jgi:Kdo2-lipid IVA lauroyltransferase/acyltransferase